MKNTSTKVWFFILFCSFSLLVIGYQLGERLGLLVGFLSALLLNIIVFFYGENRILKKFEATKVSGQDPWGMLEMVSKLSSELGISVPNVYIVQHHSANAFAVGHSWRRNSMGFTQGLLQSLTREELEAVVVHQLCHIRRLDTFAFGVSSTMANSIVGLGQFFDRFLPKLDFFKPLLSPIGWLIIKLVVNKKSFFENDLMASQFLGDRDRLGQVLWKLEGLAQTKPLKVPPCTSQLFIVNPEGFKQSNLFLKSHPAIEIRLQKLLGYYPI